MRDREPFDLFGIRNRRDEKRARRQSIEERAFSILHDLGLFPSDLAGKVIFDIAAGERVIEQFTSVRKMHGTQVFSLDINEQALRAGGKMHKHVFIRDAIDGFPLEDDTIDLAINRGGLIFGGPYRMLDHSRYRNHMNAYRDSMRVLKPGGELRISSCLADVTGITDYLYTFASRGVPQLQPTEESIRAYNALLIESGSTPLQFDTNGLPQPLNSDFWQSFFLENVPGNLQQNILRNIASDLQTAFLHERIPATLSLGFSDPQRSAKHFLVIRKSG